MSYSRRQLEAFGEPLGESVTRVKPGGRIYGGGGGGPTSTTVTQSNIPEWLRPQVETLLGGATKELFRTQQTGTDENGKPIYEVVGTRPYIPYSTNAADYFAGFSPLQQQVQYNAANLQMPGQFNTATQMGELAGSGALGSADTALGLGTQGQMSGLLGQQLGIEGGGYYGRMGAGYGSRAAALAPQAQLYGGRAADIGEMALEAQTYGANVGQQAQDYAAQAGEMGRLYQNLATSPTAYEAYMSPYQQAVTDLQLEGARRQADIARQARKSQAARAGAYGGARQAIEEAEANRALQTQLQGIQAQGLQSAYQQAQQNILNRAQIGLQGLSGAQQGLGTALQGGQLGLSGIGQAMAGQQAGLSGLGQAGQLYGLGMQGAGMGLQGLQQQLAGTAQGMQGAQVGLQGVQGAQAGYGLANQTAANLANIGAQQLAAQTGILGLQNQIGGQQQAFQQGIINQAIQNYAQQQEAPYNALAQYNALLRGYAVPGQTTSQYQAQPALASQVAGLGTAGIAGLGLYNTMNR